jgi:hypothetical protein
MPLPIVTKISLAAALAFALGAASPAAADPTPAAIGYAKTILTDIGMKPQLDKQVPALLGELEREVLATNPQLKAPLQQTLLDVTPEFVATEEPIFDEAATFLAGQLTEQELKDTAAFYESPTGKKFIAAQPVGAQHIAVLAGDWRKKLTIDMLERVRAEMKKKGFSF